MADTMNLDGRVALVTGSASGIGRATTKTLAEHGATVILADIDEEGVADSCMEIGGASESRMLDVRDEGAWAALIDDIGMRHGRLDILSIMRE